MNAPEVMYRALYQRPAPGSRLRGMTFTARSAAEAARIAADWALASDKLLTVTAVRELARPLLELAP